MAITIEEVYLAIEALRINGAQLLRENEGLKKELEQLKKEISDGKTTKTI